MSGPGDRWVLVCGGRGYHTTKADAIWLRSLVLEIRATGILHGACVHTCFRGQSCRRRSVDIWGGEVGARLGLQVRAFPPEYDRYGPGAPLRRNLGMLDLRPVAVAAFPGGSGTEHTCRHAEHREILVVRRHAAKR